MCKTLILFTKNFPYGEAEPFLEEEIKVASYRFNKIILFACQVRKSQNIKRKVPDNVKVIAIKAYKPAFIMINSPIYLIKGIITQELVREWKYCVTFKQKIFSIYFYTKLSLMYKNCKKDFRKMVDFSADNIIYSYWFFDITMLAVKLRDRFLKDSSNMIITRCHGYDLYKERNVFRYFPFRVQTLESIDKVFACSRHGKKYLQNEFKKYKNKISCQYLGTQDCGLGVQSAFEEGIRIVTCSNIIALKRVKRLAQALHIIEKNKVCSQIEWVCFGDGEALDELIQYCQENLKETNVIFMHHCPNSEVLSFYLDKKVDLFVNLSISEGLPVSIMEAMSFGIPIIATNVGGTSEIVINDITGVLLNRDFTDDDLVKAIMKVALGDREYIDNMRLQCRKYWKDNFQSKANYDKFYLELVKSFGSRGGKGRCNSEI